MYIKTNMKISSHKRGCHHSFWVSPLPPLHTNWALFISISLTERGREGTILHSEITTTDHSSTTPPSLPLPVLEVTHEHRLKGVAEPMGQECNAILTVEHILLNCKKFENSRKNHLKNITSMKNVFDNNEYKTIL